MGKKTFKISSKGQVTIPKEIRNYLNSAIVEFSIEEEKVVLKGVRNVAGKLKGYNNPELREQEKTAWADAAQKKHGHR